MYSVFAPIMEGDRDGVRKIEMVKEIEKDRGVRWKEIKKCTVPVCRDPVFCAFKRSVLRKRAQNVCFQSNPCSETQGSASFGRVKFGGGF
jgi:hypothetical protein